MKINLQIEDATPEEFAHVLYALQPIKIQGPQQITLIRPHPPEHHRGENLGRSTIPSDELKKQIPDPAGPEDLGACRDCDNGKGDRFNSDRCDECAPAPEREPAKKAPAKGKRGGNRKSGNKYGIPSELRKTDKKRYDALWARCKTHGIMYEEALKRDGIKGGGRPPKSATKKTDPQTITKPAEKLSEERSRIDKPPSDIKTEVVKKPFPPPSTAGTSTLPPEESALTPVVPDEDPLDIHIEGAEELVNKMPEERPPTTGDPGKIYRNPRNPMPVRDPPEEFKVGLHVKQVKPFQDRIVPDKVGIITARVGGLVEVNFGGTRYVKIAPECLEVQ